MRRGERREERGEMRERREETDREREWVDRGLQKSVNGRASKSVIF